MFSNIALKKLNSLVKREDFDEFLHVGKDTNVVAVIKFKNKKVC